MDLQRPLFVFSLLLLSLLTDGASAARDLDMRVALTGSFKPIKDLSDPYVVEIAKFAVSEHNKDASDDLVFVKVVSGEEQVVYGIYYKLIIEARHGVAPASVAGDQYKALVYDNPWEKYQNLTTFQKV